MKNLTVGTLIQALKGHDKKAQVKVACDEEWNHIFTNVRIQKDETGSLVFYGLSGSEEDRGF